MILIAFSMLLSVDRTILFLEERVETTIDGQPIDRYTRSIYFDRSRVLIDFPRSKQRLIYNMALKTLYVIDLEKKRYFLARPNTFKEKTSRKPLLWVAQLQGDRLERGGPILRKTGRSEQIEGYTCYEYEITPHSEYNVKTTIWATRYLTQVDRGLIKADKRSIRQLWLAALGIDPPFDVRALVSKILDNLDGLPIRTITTVLHDELPVTTTSTIIGVERQTRGDKFFSIPPNFEIVQPKDPFVDRPWSQNDQP